MATKRSCPISGMKKVLLATDGSDCSETALKEALSLSKACASKLYVLSVVEVNPEYEALAPMVVEKAEREARQLLESIKKRAVKEGITCETVIHWGDEPSNYIVKEAEKKKANMIVMGIHGRKGLRKLMMGSVTAKVLAHTPCSVLVVKSAS